MRTILLLTVLLTTLAAAQSSKIDPERILSERFGFSAAEVAQARQGQPVVHVNTAGDELTGLGAIRLPGKKERLADWLKNVELFRTSAELGVTHVIPAPPAAAAFAGVTLDAADLDELRQCKADGCGFRISGETLPQLQAIDWRSPDAASQATGVVRQMLLRYLSAYMNGGNADDLRQLIARAQTLTEVAPEFVTYLTGYPKATLPSVDQIFYWSSMPAGSNTILSVHHLMVYRRGPGEIWIADKNLYSSRYFDAAGTAIGLYDAADGAGFYAVAGSRMKVSKLDGVAARLLRRQVERSAADTVTMYLEWIRESLAK